MKGMQLLIVPLETNIYHKYQVNTYNLYLSLIFLVYIFL